MLELIIAAKIFWVRVSTATGRERGSIKRAITESPPPTARDDDPLLSPSRSIAFIIRPSLFRPSRTKVLLDERLISENHQTVARLA